MKINISTLMNLVAEKEREALSLEAKLREHALNTTIQELDGRKNILEDNKEQFTKEMKELENLTEEIVKLKSILYEKNNTFRLSNGQTIQQAIIENKKLRELKTIYESLLMFKNSKKRFTEVNNSYFEIKEINFNVDEYERKIKELGQKIQDTDFEISKLNSEEFDIEF